MHSYAIIILKIETLDYIMGCKMYKLIVVDDEDAIRIGLRDYFNTKLELGFSVVASFSNGSDAIDYLSANPVDVVLTDIKMPVKSGLDIAKYIYENNYKIKVVLLSGYSEFEYAQKGIAYSVNHYLLKPTNFKEVREVFGKLKDKLDFEQRNYKNINDDSIFELQEQFFLDLVLGAIRNKNDIDDQLQALKLDFIGDTCSLLVVSVLIMDIHNEQKKKMPYGRQGIVMAIRSVIKQSNRRFHTFKLFYNYPEIKFVVVMEKDSQIQKSNSSSDQNLSMSDEKKLDSLTHDIEEKVKYITSCEIIVKIDSEYNNIYELYKYSALKNDILIKERVLLLFTYMNSRDLFLANNLINSIVDDIEHSNLSDIHSYLLNLFSMINNNFIMIGINLTKISAKFDFFSVVNMDKIEDIREFSINLVKNIIEYLSNMSEISTEVAIKNAKKFIQDNYTTDISLEDVSEHVFLSSAYFSRLFKHETGENFIDYLVRIRMEKAVEYIKKGYKISVISEKVGFNSSKYFSRTFRKYYGLTPTEYMRNI